MGTRYALCVVDNKLNTDLTRIDFVDILRTYYKTDDNLIISYDTLDFYNINENVWILSAEVCKLNRSIIVRSLYIELCPKVKKVFPKPLNDADVYVE